jgi:hypothetical protein
MNQHDERHRARMNGLRRSLAYSAAYHGQRLPIIAGWLFAVGVAELWGNG